MKPIRVYADTSVFGGILDEEFCEESKVFFDQVKSGAFLLVTSAIVQEEIRPAPKEIRFFFDQMVPLTEIASISKEMLDLRDAYLDAKIVSHQFSDDALHVAIATVSGCSLIVSWNFKHIVHFDKIKQYNAINMLKGFSEIAIFSPLEVISYEK